MQLSKINFVAIDPRDDIDLNLLYALLMERPPYANISHNKMPSWESHIKFVTSNPYKRWHSIRFEGKWVGAIYCTKHNEIGIGILEMYRSKHIGTSALTKYIQLYNEDYFLANIAPKNWISTKVFEKLGFKLIQKTYKKMGRINKNPSLEGEANSPSQ